MKRMKMRFSMKKMKRVKRLKNETSPCKPYCPKQTKFQMIRTIKLMVTIKLRRRVREVAAW